MCTHNLLRGPASHLHIRHCHFAVNSGVSDREGRVWEHDDVRTGQGEGVERRTGGAG